ncbi:MAG TPA: DUF4350 domain-containing protein [Candidatus Thermoplasmatota archaeon]|nr:DUF4350 domain-containing protein [Candidatus Thermoplasmatota archaeon]
MKGAPAALAAAAILLLVAASTALPVLRDGARPSHPGATWFWGSYASLPRNGTLVVESAAASFSPADVAALQAFLLRGGRLLVADVTASSASLVHDLDIGTEATASRVFDPDVDARGNLTLHASGVLGITGTQSARRANVLEGNGEPILSTGPFAWRDRDADGRPDVGEPRGAWTVAMLVQAGGGQVVVLGDPAFLRDAPSGPALQAWMRERGPLLVDGVHRAGLDPLGASPLLGGANPGPILLALAALLLVGGLTAFRVLVRRATPPRARRVPDTQTLELLAELPE